MNKTKETVEVQKVWLETLLKLSVECEKAQDEWFETEKPLMPTCLSKLIGYSSSAKTMLGLNKKH